MAGLPKRKILRGSLLSIMKKIKRATHFYFVISDGRESSPFYFFNLTTESCSARRK